MKWQVESVKKKKGKKSYAMFSFAIVSSVTVKLKVFQLQAFSHFFRKKKKKENKKENSVEMVRCNGPKQGNRSTTKE